MSPGAGSNLIPANPSSEPDDNEGQRQPDGGSGSPGTFLRYFLCSWSLIRNTFQHKTQIQASGLPKMKMTYHRLNVHEGGAVSFLADRHG
jgi:hypothetical protein